MKRFLTQIAGFIVMVFLSLPNMANAETERFLPVTADSEIDVRLVQSNVEHLKATNECEKCDLRRAVLNGVNLERAKLRGANLRGAQLIRSNLKGANLKESYLGQADFSYANLEGADLSNASLANEYGDKKTSFILKGANFSTANLSSANLSNTSFEECDFSKANLSKAILINVSISYVNLRNANLSAANLTRAHSDGNYIGAYDGADFTNLTCPNGKVISNKTCS